MSIVEIINNNIFKTIVNLIFSKTFKFLIVFNITINVSFVKKKFLFRYSCTFPCGKTNYFSNLK